MLEIGAADASQTSTSLSQRGRAALVAAVIQTRRGAHSPTDPYHLPLRNPSRRTPHRRRIPRQVRVPLSCAVRSSWQFYRIRFEVKLSYSYRKRNVLNGPRNRRAWRIHLTAGDSHSVPDRRIEEARRICRERRESGTIVNRNRKRARHICRTHGDAASSRVNNSSSGLKIRCKEAHDTYCNM